MSRKTPVWVRLIFGFIYVYMILILYDRATGSHLLDFENTRWIGMVFNTALLFVCLTTALLIATMNSTRLRPVYGLLLFVVAVSLLSLTQDLTGLNFGIDEFFVRDASVHPASIRPGSMSPLTALNFILLSTITALTLSKLRHGAKVALLLMASVFALVVINLCGRFFNAPELGNLPGYTHMATTTAFVFSMELILIIGVFPELLLDRTRSSPIFKALIFSGIPALIATPLFFGWTLKKLESIGWMDPELSFSLIVALFIATGVIGLVGLGGIIYRLEQSGKAASEKYNRFFSLSKDFLVIATSDRHALDINDTWETELGWPREELLSKPLTLFVFEPDRSKSNAYAEQIKSNTGRYTQCFKLQPQFGEPLEIEWSASRDPESGLIYAIGRDVTLQQQMMNDIHSSRIQAENASRAKSDFLANMSHELRTPLNSIIGFSEVLEDQLYGPLEPRQKEYVGYIVQSSHHLLNLINDILDLSKIEAGKMVLNIAPVSVRQAVETANIMIRERALRKNIRVAAQYEADEEYIALADERKVKQILYNLLSNAVKFTADQGSVTVSTRHSTIGEKPAIQITVADNGIGIADEQKPYLFKEFHQLDGVFEKTHEGTGLGLVLTKRLIELHGGSITVDSQAGEGSSFTVLIPVHPVIEEGEANAIQSTDC